jgi:general secretion pathway protein H
MMIRRRAANGYTLVEILVVLFIISIVTSVALLSIGRNENKQLETFANELTQIMTLAEEQAMLQPLVLGVSLSEDKVRFTSLQTAKDGKKNLWEPLQNSILNKHNIPNGIQLRIDVGGTRTTSIDKDDQKNPQIIISTNGDVTPFTIYIGKKGQKPRYAVVGDADGNITNRALS